MSGWGAVLVASGACFAVKLLGYVVPGRWLERERVVRTAPLITAALLAALLAVAALTSGRTIRVDARVPALGVAAVLLWRRAPFIVVVVAAAAVAAGLRALT